MEDGAKKAAGIGASLLIGIGAIAVRFADNCGGVAARSARYGDDVVHGVGSADDLGRYASHGDDLSGSGHVADDLARADDALHPHYGEGRTGGSFGGSRFGDEAVTAAVLAEHAPPL